MFMRRGFSENAVKQANIRMILGEKPKSHVSDKLSNEDIAFAWRKASMRVFGDMNEQNKHSGIYERLVENDHDFLGQVAYSIYKRRKREFVMRKQSELGTTNLPDEAIYDFVRAQTDYTLDLYRDEAEKLSREFLNASYEAELNEAVQYLDSHYREKYEELARNLRSHSWWYGVGQSIAASFLFLLAGYVLLKMSGSWDILLSNLLK